MIRGLQGTFMLDDFATVQSIGEPARQENIIKPQMRIPDRESVSLLLRVKRTIAVRVTRVAHELNSIALNIAAAQPDEPSNPRRHATHVKDFTGRQRIEISNQNMKAVLMSFNALQQGLNLPHPAALAPLRKCRA